MDSKIIDVMIQAVGQTVYMVFFSTLFASILGFILGIVVTVTSPKGLKPNKIIYNVLDLIIIIFGAILYAIAGVFSTALITMRRNGMQLIIYLIDAIFSVIISYLYIWNTRCDNRIY
jgi:ABC-type methionine transport system permease subunit